MDSLNPANPPPLPAIDAPPKRRVFGFGGTAPWGACPFATSLIGQIMVVAYEVLRRGDWDNLVEAIEAAARSGMTLSLSVIMGLPAVVLALWFVISFTSTSFADYLALRGTTWKNLLIGV